MTLASFERYVDATLLLVLFIGALRAKGLHLWVWWIALTAAILWIGNKPPDYEHPQGGRNHPGPTIRRN